MRDRPTLTLAQVRALRAIRRRPLHGPTDHMGRCLPWASALDLIEMGLVEPGPQITESGRRWLAEHDAPVDSILAASDAEIVADVADPKAAADEVRRIFEPAEATVAEMRKGIEG